MLLVKQRLAKPVEIRDCGVFYGVYMLASVIYDGRM